MTCSWGVTRTAAPGLPSAMLAPSSHHTAYTTWGGHIQLAKFTFFLCFMMGELKPRALKVLGECSSSPENFLKSPQPLPHSTGCLLHRTSITSQLLRR